MTRIAFVVPWVPVAQPRQRTRVMTINGKALAQNYTPAKAPVNAFKAAVALAASAAYNGPPLDGPLRVCLTFVLARPQKVKTAGRAWAPKKPDVDNLLKATADALNGQLWLDDKQIVVALIGKKYAAADEQPKTEVEVCVLD